MTFGIARYQPLCLAVWLSATILLDYKLFFFLSTRSQKYFRGSGENGVSAQKKIELWEKY